MSMIRSLYAWQYNARQWYVGQVWSRRGSAANGGGLPREPERALILLCGLIGDTVMSTPVLVEARRLWPRARITMLGTRSTCDLLGACPLIDECKVTPAVPFTIRNGRGVAELGRWLREQRFDVALILLGDQFASTLAEAGIPARVGVRGTPLEPCLTATYDIKNPREWGPREARRPGSPGL